MQYQQPHNTTSMKTLPWKSSKCHHSTVETDVVDLQLLILLMTCIISNLLAVTMTQGPCVTPNSFLKSISKKLNKDQHRRVLVWVLTPDSNCFQKGLYPMLQILGLSFMTSEDVSHVTVLITQKCLIQAAKQLETSLHFISQGHCLPRFQQSSLRHDSLHYVMKLDFIASSRFHTLVFFAYSLLAVCSRSQGSLHAPASISPICYSASHLSVNMVFPELQIQDLLC